MKKRANPRETLLQELADAKARIRELEQEIAGAPLLSPQLSNASASLILDMISTGFFSLDQQSRFTYINRAGKEIFKRYGINPESLIGSSVTKVFSSGLGSAFYEHHQKAIMTGETVEFEEFFPALNAWLEVHAYPSLEGISISFRDITDRKQMAEALLESEVRFRSLAESAPDGILTTDSGGKILFANPAIEKIFGYKTEELLGEPLTLLMPEPMRARYQNSLQQYVYSGLKHFKWERVEFPGLHKNGSLIPLELSYSESIQEGKPVFHSIIRDITERKKAEEMIRKSEASARMLFNRNPSPMWVFDLDTLTFLEVNQAACDFYGYSREAFLSMKATDIRPPEEIPRFLEIIRLIKGEEHLKSYGIFTHLLKNGEKVEMEIVAQQITFNGKNAVLSVMKNVTRQKQEERELRGSEAKYRFLFEANPEPMYIIDLDTLRFLDVNHAAIKQYGYSREEFLSMSLLDIRPDQEAPKLKQHLQSLPYPSSGLEYSGRWLHRRKDGTTFWVEVLAESIEMEGKRARFAAARPLEDPREPRRALLDCALSYPLCLESHPDPAYLVDLETQQILAANEATLKRYGYKKEELFSMKIWDLHPAEDVAKFKEFLKSIPEPGIIKTGVWRHRTMDKGIMWVEVAVETVIVNGKKAWLVVPRLVDHPVTCEKPSVAS